MVAARFTKSQEKVKESGFLTPPAPKRGLDDHDPEVARALLRGKHGVADDPHRTVSPTDVTADVYA